MLSPEKWTEKMLQRVQAAGPAWEEGIRDTDKPIVGSMRAANGKFKANVTKALQEDRWLKRISTLDDAKIKAQALKVGGQALVNGVQARADKIREAITKLAPKVNALQAKIRALPQDTDQQREQRMLENLRGMRAIKNV